MILPQFPVDQLNISEISHQIQIQQSYLSDPAIHHKGTPASIALGILQNIAILPSVVGALDAKVSVLLLHGEDDRICAVQGSRDVFEWLGAKDKKLVLYPGVRHELLWEDDARRDILKWLLVHLNRDH